MFGLMGCISGATVLTVTFLESPHRADLKSSLIYHFRDNCGQMAI